MSLVCNFADLANFGHCADSSLALSPKTKFPRKLAKNYKSHTAIAAMVAIVESKLCCHIERSEISQKYKRFFA